MKHRTTADVLRLMQAAAAVLAVAHEKHDAMAWIVAGAAVDHARGTAIEANRGEDVWAAHEARLEAAVQSFEASAVYMLGEARQPGEEAGAYFIRIGEMCQPDLSTAMRERGFEPPEEDTP